jgi:predicted hotdog family 3-hydroxylacyl-ACP dehydratase
MLGSGVAQISSEQETTSRTVTLCPKATPKSFSKLELDKVVEVDDDTVVASSVVNT